MIQQPQISVIVPNYNSFLTISSCLESVSKQSFKEWECIIVDDCSEDGSVEIILDYVSRDSRFRFLSTTKNSGSPSEPRNIGIKEAAGEFIAFLDSDDYWDLNKLQTQLYFHRKKSVDWSCTAYVRVEVSGKMKTKHPVPTASFNDLLKNNHICLSSVMISRRMLSEKHFLKIGHEDYALWLSLSAEGALVYGILTPLTYHIRRQRSVSSNKLKVVTFYWKIYRQVLRFNISRSIYMMFSYGLRRFFK